MSMLTTVYLIERYGLRLTVEQLAEALGNSWAVPVVRWIGERINAAVEQIKHERKAA